MFYVYILQSIQSPKQQYVGYTTNLKKRFSDHNAGKSIHTAKYIPWILRSYHAFTDKRKAQEFEYYLKSGSGKAFLNKHL